MQNSIEIQILEENISDNEIITQGAGNVSADISNPCGDV